MKRLLCILTGLVLFGCDAAEIEKICDPSKVRESNIVYNAHYDGQFTIENDCSDTATVFITERTGDKVPPGGVSTYMIDKGLQYIVVVNCNDSALNYTFVNECP